MDRMTGRLPGLYDKSDDSNINKLFRMLSAEIDEVNDTLDKTKDWRDVDQAEGKVLDRIGQNLNVLRRDKGDIEYRRFLKMKITSHQSRGDIETLNEIARVVVGEPFIGIEEFWYEQPATCILNFELLELYERIEEEYEDLDNDPWYFDGEYNFDGERQFDGGYIYDASDRIEDIQNLISNLVDIIYTATAGGVRLYVRGVINFKNVIEINQSLEKEITKETTNTYNINQDMDKSVNKNMTETATAYLDGSNNLDGGNQLDGERDRILQELDIEVIENA